jgi:hypothetical protein
MNQLTLAVTGDRVKQLIVRRSSELEGEILEAKKIQSLTPNGMMVPFGRNPVDLETRLHALKLVHDLIDPTVTYNLTLADLAQMDLIALGIVIR